jgi:transcriptional regulator with XRE-family HTH domain
MRSFSPSKTRIKLTPGATVRIAREMHGMAQSDLEKLSGIKQSAISAIECGKEELGLERAKALGSALNIHPAVLLFPDLQMSASAEKKRKQG